MAPKTSWIRSKFALDNLRTIMLELKLVYNLTSKLHTRHLRILKLELQEFVNELEKTLQKSDSPK